MPAVKNACSSEISSDSAAAFVLVAMHEPVMTQAMTPAALARDTTSDLSCKKPLAADLPQLKFGRISWSPKALPVPKQICSHGPKCVTVRIQHLMQNQQ